MQMTGDTLQEKLNALCSWCRHTEFIHSDQDAGPCLFSECKCPRFFPLPERTEHQTER